MMIRNTIASSLVLLCFIVVGCSRNAEPSKGKGAAGATEGTESLQKAQKAQTDAKESLKNAIGNIESAQKFLGIQTSGNPAVTAGRVSDRPDESKPQIQQALKAISEVGTDLAAADLSLYEVNEALTSGSDTNLIREIDAAKKSIYDAKRDLSLAKTSLDGAEKRSPEAVIIANGSLTSARSGLVNTQSVLARIEILSNLGTSPSFLAQVLSDWGATVAILLGCIIALVLIGVVLKAALKRAAADVDRKFAQKIQPILGSIQKQQAEFESQISSLKITQNDLKVRLDDVQDELRSVARRAREVSLDGGSRRISSGPSADYNVDKPPPKQEPEFPVSAVDYLGKMRRSANIVRPDFQNGILVSDPDGKGELVLIRHANIPDELQSLFVIPRATQFQTKQDFHTYYEKYYDCARPSAGDVWIIDPAVVSKVAGGWQLREKGVLEIR